MPTPLNLSKLSITAVCQRSRQIGVCPNKLEEISEEGDKEKIGL